MLIWTHYSKIPHVWNLSSNKRLFFANTTCSSQISWGLCSTSRICKDPGCYSSHCLENWQSPYQRGRSSGRLSSASALTLKWPTSLPLINHWPDAALKPRVQSYHVHKKEAELCSDKALMITTTIIPISYTKKLLYTNYLERDLK